MKTTRRTLLFASIGLALLVGSGIALFYTEFRIPLDRMRDPNWWASAPVEEQRALCHKCLRSPFLDDHDAFLRLATIGDDSSVELIINALPDRDSPACPCPYVHGMDALRELTGHDAGDSLEAWHRWWKAEGRREYGHD